jgi:hypothetical protein
MGLAIADYLPDFTPRPRPVAAPAALRPEPSRPAPVAPPIDVDSLIATAVARAESELAARLEGLYAERAAEDEARHAEELTALRSALAVDLAARASKAMAELETKVIGETTALSARILGQIVDQAVRDRAIAALADVVRAAIGDVETIRIRVSGPQSMFLPFAAAMGEEARHLEFLESEAVDLTVALDETLFETRIAEWSSALAEAIG